MEAYQGNNTFQRLLCRLKKQAGLINLFKSIICQLWLARPNKVYLGLQKMLSDKWYLLTTLLVCFLRVLCQISLNLTTLFIFRKYRPCKINHLERPLLTTLLFNNTLYVIE